MVYVIVCLWDNKLTHVWPQQTTHSLPISYINTRVIPIRPAAVVVMEDSGKTNYN